MYKIFLLFLFLIGPLTAKEKYLKRQFQTDKCTGWINGIGDIYWGHCCIIHDLYMWGGGTRVHRDQADINLRECVKDAGSAFHGNLMYRAVRLGQYSPISFKSKRWGHAWPDDYRYENLSSKDIDILREHLEKTDVTDISTHEIQNYLEELERINP